MTCKVTLTPKKKILFFYINWCNNNNNKAIIIPCKEYIRKIKYGPITFINTDAKILNKMQTNVIKLYIKYIYHE